MASKKISQLPLATQVDGDDIIPLVQAGVSKKTTVDDILSSSTYLEFETNEDAVAALGVGKLYKSTTSINGSPIILITV